MRKKKVWRYYCEYCGKGGCSGGHMQNHEDHCTKNPNRDCRMCAFQCEKKAPNEILEKIISAHIAKYTNHEIWDLVDNQWYTSELIEQLEDATHNCPACILAAIRQFAGDWNVEWNYQQACEQYWKEYNEDRVRHGYY